MSENGTAEAVDADALVTRVQELKKQLEAIQDPAARDLAEELTAAIVQMYGAGLERIVAAIADAGPAGQEIMGALSRDGVAASLLLIHDLFPVSVEERVLEALERVRPYMESHGGNVEFLGVHQGIAHLRLEGSCKTCSASSSTLELAVRQALEEAAPDLEGMEVEGVFEDEEEPTGPVLDSSRPGSPSRPRPGLRSSWTPRWRACRSWWPTSRARCWPTATAARPAAPRCAGVSSAPAR